MFSVKHSFHLKKKRGRAGNQAENQEGAGNLSGSQGGARPKKFGKHCSKTITLNVAIEKFKKKFFFYCRVIQTSKHLIKFSKIVRKQC